MAEDNVFTKYLKKTAVALGLMTATVPLNAQNAEQQNKDASKNSIELVADKTYVNEDGLDLSSQADLVRSDTTNFQVRNNYDNISSQGVAIKHLDLEVSDEGYRIVDANGKTLFFDKEDFTAKSAEDKNFNIPQGQPKIIRDTLKNVEDILEHNSSRAAYNVKTNEICLMYSQIKSADLAKQADSLKKEGELSSFDYMRYRGGVSYLKDLEQYVSPEAQQSLITHEQSHAEDVMLGVFEKKHITNEQYMLLDMATEIKATMAQAKLEYDKYEKTGNVEEIGKITSFEFKGFKKWLQQNENASRSQKMQGLAKAVYEEWLQINNNEKSGYYFQALINARINPNNDDGRPAGSMFENKVNRAEYLQRWNKMFENTALGDVRNVISPDFQLGKGASLNTDVGNNQQSSDVVKFLSDVTKNAESIEQINQELKSFFKKANRTATKQTEDAKNNQMIVSGNGGVKYILSVCKISRKMENENMFYLKNWQQTR